MEPRLIVEGAFAVFVFDEGGGSGDGYATLEMDFQSEGKAEKFLHNFRTMINENVSTKIETRAEKWCVIVSLPDSEGRHPVFG